VEYLSTRHSGPQAAARSFDEVLLTGLAEDGGLFVPASLPSLTREDFAGYAGLPYAEVAARIMALFAGDSFSLDELRRLANTAYRDFRHAATTWTVERHIIS